MSTARAVEPSRAAPPEAREVAWLAALPCALLTFAGILLIGPPLGRAFLGPGDVVFWETAAVHVEPAEHGRYVVALLGPLLLAAVVLASGRLRWRPPQGAARIAAVAVQLTVIAVLVLAGLAQYNIGWRVEQARPSAILKPWMLIAAAALTLLALVVMRRERIAAALARIALRETRARRIACTALAALLTAVWLLTAVNTDDTIGDALGVNLIPWTMNETFAVLDGRTPLVDFHATYGQLLSYAPAAAMALLGKATTTEWTVTMASISGLSLLAVYATLRRVVRSSLLALLLFLPVLATGFFTMIEIGDSRLSPASIFSLWPVRYAGPYLLAWLTARHVDRAAPRQAWLLLCAGGLVAINNPEFGVGAFAGTLAALLCARPPTSWRAAGRLLAEAAGGLLAAWLLVSLVALVRTGELPDLGLLLEFSRLIGVGGWSLVPMPAMGFHVALYVTFSGALVLAAVRAKRAEPDVVLTGMLAWSGTFGLIAGSYYVGHSDGLGLISMLSAWSLAVALLLVAVVRDLAARGWRRPAPLQVAVLFAFAFTACCLTQLPSPGTQLSRIANHKAAPEFATPETVQLVDRLTDPGERVALLVPVGQRIAYDLDLTNVAPYSSVESMPTPEQTRDTIALLRREGVRHVFLGNYDTTPGDFLPDVAAAFREAGYEPRGRVQGVIALVDGRR